MMNYKHHNLIEKILMLAPAQIPKKLKIGVVKFPLATEFKEDDFTTSKLNSKKSGCFDCNKN